MNVRRVTTELCWFGASLLALGAYGSIVAWIDASTGYEASPARDALLMLSAATAVVTVLLILLAFCIEHQRDLKSSIDANRTRKDAAGSQRRRVPFHASKQAIPAVPAASASTSWAESRGARRKTFWSHGI